VNRIKPLPLKTLVNKNNFWKKNALKSVK